jgi:hypothetical protein
VKRAALLGGVLLLTACGSSTPTPYRQAANSACVQFSVAVKKLKEQAGIDGYRTWVDSLTSLAENYVNTLGDLTPPPQLAKLAATYLTFERKNVATLHKLQAAAAKAKDSLAQPIVALMADLRARGDYEASLERKLGLDACASA